MVTKFMRNYGINHLKLVYESKGFSWNFSHCQTSFTYIYLVSEDVNKKFILESRKGYSHRCPCKIAKMILKQVRTLAFIMIRSEINGKLSLNAIPPREPSL